MREEQFGLVLLICLSAGALSKTVLGCIPFNALIELNKKQPCVLGYILFNGQ